MSWAEVDQTFRFATDRTRLAVLHSTRDGPPPSLKCFGSSHLTRQDERQAWTHFRNFTVVPEDEYFRSVQSVSRSPSAPDQFIPEDYHYPTRSTVITVRHCPRLAQGRISRRPGRSGRHSLFVLSSTRGVYVSSGLEPRAPLQREESVRKERRHPRGPWLERGVQGPDTGVHCGGEWRPQGCGGEMMRTGHILRNRETRRGCAKSSLRA